MDDLEHVIERMEADRRESEALHSEAFRAWLHFGCPCLQPRAVLCGGGAPCPCPCHRVYGEANDVAR